MPHVYHRGKNIRVPASSRSRPTRMGGVFAVQRAPTDSIGTLNATFLGVNADCEIRVFNPSGVEVAGVETCTANHVLSWPVYPAGQPENTVMIRIVHSAYKIKEFAYVSGKGDKDIFVQQENDPWYKNPV